VVDDSKRLHGVLVGDEVSRDTFAIAGALAEVLVDCCSHPLGVAHAGDDVVHLLETIRHAVLHSQDSSSREHLLPLLLVL
jgi:hypothetical protein